MFLQENEDAKDEGPMTLKTASQPTVKEKFSEGNM